MTDEDRAILKFEETNTLDGPHLDEYARVHFGMKRGRYQQHLIQLLATPEALVEFPQLVYRHQRLMAKKLARRNDRARHSLVA
jgi:hypothetical protein